MISLLKNGSNVKFMYPTHGRLNALRNVRGTVIETGSGPGGNFVKVDEGDGKFRNFSTRKIVQM